MGNSQSNNGLVGCTPPTPPTAQQLQGMAKGASVQVGSCTVCPGTLYANCNSLLGSEWGNDSSVSSGAGCFLNCTKTSYSAPAATCCMGQTPGAPASCDPNMTPTSSSCAATMNSQCTGANVFLNPCQQWGSSAQNTSAYNAQVASYCFSGSNMTTNTNCRTWISQQNSKYDSQMTNYCGSYPDDPLCTCITSSVTPCPEKFDKNCVATGYLTASMQEVNCPTVLTCNQYVNLPANAQSALIDNAITQNCSATTNTTNISGGSSSTATSTQDQTKSTSPMTTYGYYLLAIIIFIVVICGLLMFMSGNNDDDDNSDSDSDDDDNNNKHRRHRKHHHHHHKQNDDDDDDDGDDDVEGDSEKRWYDFLARRKI